MDTVQYGLILLPLTTSRLPQGSKVRPLLFLQYNNIRNDKYTVVFITGIWLVLYKTFTINLKVCP